MVNLWAAECSVQREVLQMDRWAPNCFLPPRHSGIGFFFGGLRFLLSLSVMSIKTFLHLYGPQKPNPAVRPDTTDFEP